MTSRFLFLLAAAASVAAETPPEPKFQAVTIDDKIQIGYGVAVADVDGDKAPDILLADKKQFVWYRNPGPAKAADPAAWQKYLIAENLTEKDNVCLAAQDIDGDGKCELAVGAEWNPGDTEKSGAVFYLIPPADRTQRWDPVKFPAVEPTTHRMKWMRMTNYTAQKQGDASAENPKAEWVLLVVPLHGRGNKNGEGSPVKLIAYHPPTPLNDPKGEWVGEVVDESMHMTHNFALPAISTDFHGDPGKLVLAGKEGLTVVRHRMSGWTGMLLIPNDGGVAASRGVGEIRGARFPFSAEAVATVEPMHGNQLVVYTNLPRDPAQKAQRRVLTDQLTEGHALACGDVLGTGSDQVIVGWRGNPEKPRPVGIKLFTPMDAKGEQWRESLIDDNAMACEDLVLADLNGDGKPDIVASGRSTRNVRIYLNETPAAN